MKKFKRNTAYTVTRLKQKWFKLKLYVRNDDVVYNLILIVRQGGL